ncbi:MAG: hypothetical protein J3K34DRAFT_527044 [Monoraphidium minutum]|nr:MAG: hypothetical protein J3K34DRAFT_527044 [Monoraphidium minutum]
MTARSGLLFEAPHWEAAGPAPPQPAPQPAQGPPPAWRRAPGAPAALPGAAAGLPGAPAAAAPWAGAVDLNPGFSFAPGSPQRVAAAAPGLAGALAKLEQLRGEVARLDLGLLTHREVLQAGICRLNTELYSALRVARQQAGGGGLL